MKIVLFGATGMVGQGVLRECLLDPAVEHVLAVVRRPSGHVDKKLEELVHNDFHDFMPVANRLQGYDACFFCLGVSSAGMKEAAYHRVTYDIAVIAAQTLVHKNPSMVFCFVSGAGTDSSERGRSMWARIKGKTENAIMRLPFKASYMFRPAFIQPLHGITSKTRLYRWAYVVTAPLLPVFKAMVPKYVTTTEVVGRAMLKAARQGADKQILENDDINRLGAS